MSKPKRLHHRGLSGRKAAGVPGANTLWRRIKDYGVQLGLNPELGSVLGRLSLFGELNERQVEAGRHFARVVAKFEREVGYQRRSAASPQYNAAYGSNFTTTTNEMGLEAEENLRRSQRNFEVLERVFYDPDTRAVIEEVCCNDREVGSFEIPTLRVGLTALADYLKFPGKMENSCVDIPARRRRDRGKSSL